MAEAVTWGADEHVLIGLAVGWWLLSRRAPAPQRCASDHVLLTTMAASLLPHLLKTVFNQKRPDRCTVEGHLRGVPLSGKALGFSIGTCDVAAGLVIGAALERALRLFTGFGRRHRVTFQQDS